MRMHVFGMEIVALHRQLLCRMRPQHVCHPDTRSDA
jgi:hypothetical protein